MKLTPFTLSPGWLPRLCGAWMLLCISIPVHAWGSFGHRVTGDIAAALLGDTARRQVQQLLGDESLADAAVFMDAQRDALRERWPESPRWHYDNRAVCGTSTDACRDGQCATRQIEHFRQQLADHRTPYAQRALALRLLVHMLGDLHQPLHTSDNQDHGGNDVSVRLYAGAERQRLHAIFDTTLIRQAAGRLTAERYATKLLADYRPQLLAWQQGNVMTWAQESHQLGVNDVYRSLPGFACNRTDARTMTLPADYIQRAQRYLPEQLAKAGMRIARVLNDTLR